MILFNRVLNFINKIGMKFILGTKKEMTQVFDKTGKASAATVIATPKATVTQVKTDDADGYTAVQVGAGEQKKHRINKAQQGLGGFKFIREFRTSEVPEHKKGDTFDVSIFEPGDMVTVSGTSKGKGFQGVVKRYGFKGGPRSHGQKHSEREPGSIGATGPQRVFKGTRMAGRMGGDRVTVKNLKVLQVVPEEGLLVVSGAVPGRRGTLLEIRSASR